mgnify:CR=1 FL=1
MQGDAALTLNALAINLTRVLGPIVAGIVLAWQGSATVFALNAVLSVVAGVLIWRAPIPPHTPPAERTRLLQAMRDGVVFTTKRIIAVNVQGITGSKKDFTSLPYKNIVAYSVETSGTFDLDSELEIYFSSLGKVKFEFTGKTSIVEISRLISKHLLT